jgi:hypothetical protein
MGLTAAAHAGTWYPPLYAHGFYGGTRYMPLPVLLELAGRGVSGEYLVSAKVLILAVNVALYVLLFRAARRQGAPPLPALAIVATVLVSSAATSTALGFRWDALATLLQLGALGLVVERPARGRMLLAGVLCGLAVATKVTALWGPAAIALWWARRAPRRVLELAAAFAATAVIVVAVVAALSDGRLLRQLRDFTFAGSGHSSFSEGLHRFYQLGLRDQRALPLFVAVAAAALVVAAAARRFGPYELALVLAVPIVVVVMRDFGAYENHLLDFEVLCGVAVAGLWRRGAPASRRRPAQAVILACLLAATVAAARHTLIPDARAAAAHEWRGRADPRYALHPVPGLVAQGTCALFEDASFPILSGQQPVVLDAFITHRLQTEDRPALLALQRRIERGAFSSIALTVPLTNVGWFQTIDFGTALADAMRAHYRLERTLPGPGLSVYVPRQRPGAPPACPVAPLDRWR